MTSRTIVLKARPLTPDDFAPYGAVIGSIQDANPRALVGALWRGTLRESPCELRITTMNRHRDAGQAFMPQNRVPTLFVVGRPVDQPGESDIAAFLSDGSQGICMHPGVWHTGPIPLGVAETYANIQGTEWALHTDEISFAAKKGIEFLIET